VRRRTRRHSDGGDRRERWREKGVMTPMRIGERAAGTRQPARGGSYQPPPGAMGPGGGPPPFAAQLGTWGGGGATGCRESVMLPQSRLATPSLSTPSGRKMGAEDHATHNGAICRCGLRRCYDQGKERVEASCAEHITFCRPTWRGLRDMQHNQFITADAECVGEGCGHGVDIESHLYACVVVTVIFLARC